MKKASIIAIIIIFVFFSGYLLFANNPNIAVLDRASDMAAEKNSTNAPEQKLPSDEIVGWKTYKDLKYGFEIKYPPEWSISKRENQGHSYVIFSKPNPLSDAMSDGNLLISSYDDFYSEEEIQSFADDIEKKAFSFLKISKRCEKRRKTPTYLRPKL
jgi:hypothetical protein